MEEIKELYSIEAEQSVLGAILLGETSPLTVLNPKHFFIDEHSHIFTAMQHVWQKNISVDLVTVVEELKNMNKLDEIGGVTYLARLADSVPITTNAPHYARIINDMWQKRNLYAQMNNVDFSKDLPSIQKDLMSMAKSIEYFDKAKTMGEMISLDDVERLIESKGYATHFPTLNRAVFITKGELIIIVGDTSRGKTALAVNMVDDFLEAKAKVLFFSIDMSKLQLLSRFASMYDKVELWMLKPKYDGFNEHILNTWSNPKIQESLFLDENTIHINAIVSKIRATQPDVVVIDYVQNIISDEENPVQSLSNIMIQLQLEAHERPIIVLSQISKGVDLSISQRAKGSSTIIQAASTIIEMDREDGRFKYRIAKNRNWGETTGWVPLTTNFGYLYEEVSSVETIPYSD